MNRKTNSLFNTLFKNELSEIVSKNIQLNSELLKSCFKMFGSFANQSVSNKKNGVDIIGKLVQLNFSAYRSYMKHNQAVIQDVIDEVVSMTNTPEKAEHYESTYRGYTSILPTCIELKGYKGKTARSNFIISNPSNSIKTINISISEFQTSSEKTISSKCVSFSPQFFELAPGEEAQISIVCKITKDFTAGSAYYAFIDLSGISQKPLNVTLEVMKVKKQKAKVKK